MRNIFTLCPIVLIWLIFNKVNSNLQDFIIFHYLKGILTPSKILIKERLIKKDIFFKKNLPYNFKYFKVSKYILVDFFKLQTRKQVVCCNTINIFEVSFHWSHPMRIVLFKGINEVARQPGLLAGPSQLLWVTQQPVWVAMMRARLLWGFKCYLTFQRLLA